MTVQLSTPQGESKRAQVAADWRTARRNKMFWCYVFILPQAIVFLIFTIYPVVMNGIYSLYDWPGIGPLDDFVGWANYREALAEPLFRRALRNTLVYAFGEMVIQLPLALLLAVLLNESNLRGRTFYRAAYFLPVVTTTAVIGTVMVWIFGSYNGVVNTVLMTLGLIARPIEFLGSPQWALGVVILVGVWHTFGVKLVYWLAGLQSIPEELYDAARVDGANWWGSMRFVTLPLLTNVALVIILISSRGALHVFDLVQTMTAGGPAFATLTVDLYVYRYAFSGTFGRVRMGYAASVSVLFSIAVIAFGLFLTWLQRRSSRE